MAKLNLEYFKLVKSSAIQKFVSLVYACNMINDTSKTGMHCPTFFDGFTCWSTTHAGSTAVNACPESILGMDPRQVVSLRCDENGTWFSNPDTNEPLANYSACIDVEEIALMNYMNTINLSLYISSTVAMIIALITLIIVISPKNAMTTIQMSQFVCIIINNLIWLIWYSTVYKDIAEQYLNTIKCQLLHLFMMYFITASYMWIFFEGLNDFLITVWCPHFTVQLLIKSLRPPNGDTSNWTFELWVAVLTGSQGLSTAAMYFFLNRKDIISKIKEMRRGNRPVVQADIPMADMPVERREPSEDDINEVSDNINVP